MTKKNILKAKIKGYFKDGILSSDSTATALVNFYIEKARHNLITASILTDISENSDAKRNLKIDSDYIAYDWVVSCGYYAMFHAATAAISAIGIKSRSHVSLIDCLEYHFVFKEKVIESEDIDKIRLAHNLDEKYVNKMWSTKSKRNIAHYRADKVIAEKDAKKIYTSAVDFVDALEVIVREIE